MTEDRIPPHDLPAEKALLGLILTDSPTLDGVYDILRPEDFYADAHRRIYRQSCKCWKRSSGVDMASALSALRKSNELESVGGEAYLYEIAISAGLSSNVKRYAADIVACSEMRRLIDVTANVNSRAYDRDATPQELRKRLEESLLDEENRTDKPIMGAAAWSGKLTAYLESEDSNKFVPSGYEKLDGMLNGGFRAGQVIIVAARPGIGKSALMLSFALHAAINEQMPVGIMSLEMNAEELIMRAVASMANVSLSRIVSKTLNASEQECVRQSQELISYSKIFIDDNVHKTVTGIEATARRLIRKHGLRIMFVDYIGLVEGDDTRSNTIDRVTKISRGLKIMSRRLGIPVVALCQVNRETDKTKSSRKQEPTLKETRPGLHHLRDSGAIEQDADVVLFVHRKRDEPETELILSKQRNGQTGVVDLYFDGPCVRFDEVTVPDPEPVAEFGEYQEWDF